MMATPFRGHRRRELMKIRELIKGRLEQLEMERDELKKNIVIWKRSSKSSDITNLFVVELYFGVNYISYDDLAILLVDRLGDLFSQNDALSVPNRTDCNKGIDQVG